MTDTPSILFVCLGNICRSPLAEAALRKAAGEAGLMIEIDSAGTGAWHVDEPPDRRAQSIARQHGIDISGYRGRQVTPRDFMRFDHIVALDNSNLGNLQTLRPNESTAILSLLLDHVPGREGEDVHDPYFGDASGFEETWKDVTVGAEALVEKLRTTK